MSCVVRSEEWSFQGFPMSESALQGVAGRRRPADRAEMPAHDHAQHLTLLRRRPTKDRALLAYQAANDKARELGWIV